MFPISKRVVRIQPYGMTGLKTVNGVQCNAASRDTMVFQFPDGIIDLASLQFLFRYNRLSAAVPEIMPKDTETFLDELEVTLGSTVVNRISNYQQLFFILSGYAMDADWALSTQPFQRAWTNRRVNITSANNNGYMMAMDTFLGLLGSKAVIDTRKTGRLTVRMRLGDRFTTNSGLSTGDWGMNDPYFSVHYLADGSPSAERVTFEDFTSIRDCFPGYNCKTTLIVDGRRKIDYVVARQITVANHDAKFNAVPPEVALTQKFISSAQNLAGWDFYVNGEPCHSYKPAVEEAYSAMRNLFPKGNFNFAPINSVGTVTFENVFGRIWATGIRLDLPQREDGQQHELAFETTASASGVTVPQYTWLYARTTSAISTESGSLQLLV